MSQTVGFPFHSCLLPQQQLSRIDVLTSGSMKTEFHQKPLPDFWIELWLVARAPGLWCSLPPCTYIHESWFSATECVWGNCSDSDFLKCSQTLQSYVRLLKHALSPLLKCGISQFQVDFIKRLHVCLGKAVGVVRILKCSVVLYKNKTTVIFPLFVITSNTTSCNQHQWCLCVCPHVRAPSFVCVSMQDYLIHPVSQCAVSFRMALCKKTNGNSWRAAVLWPCGAQWYALSWRIITLFTICLSTSLELQRRLKAFYHFFFSSRLKGWESGSTFYEQSPPRHLAK